MEYKLTIMKENTADGYDILLPLTTAQRVILDLEKGTTLADALEEWELNGGPGGGLGGDGGDGTQPIEISIPAQNGTLTYNGTAQSPVWSNYDGDKMSMSGVVSGTNAGSYEAVFTPKQGYKWSDDTTSAKTVEWVINKAAGGLSGTPASLTLDNINLTRQFTVTRIGDGHINVSSTNTNVATAAVNNETGVVTVSHVNKQSGTATIIVSVAPGVNYTSPSEQSCTVSASFIRTLDETPWATIRELSDAGVGANYFSVGDRKAVTLSSGTVGEGSLAGTYYVYILGFNHNSAKEGANRIHFQFGFTALTGGTAIAFTDSKYGGGGTTAAFRMGLFTLESSNVGGWNGSYMRTTICPAFRDVLPSDLQDVLKPVTKYSDNTGGTGGDVANYVTATTDTIFLASEYEVHGVRSMANSAEQNYQLQYDYYNSGNSKVKYKSKDTDSAAFWWLRSVYVSTTHATSFCRVEPAGSANKDPAYYHAHQSIGFAPCFCV